MRNTKQKRLVAEVIDAAEHPLTVAEVLDLAQRQLPGLGIATVYREIGRLCEAGMLQAVTIPGDPPRYESAGHHHHHFKCHSCSRVYELADCMEDMRGLAPVGFAVQSHDLTLYGLCDSCNHAIV